MGVETKLLEDLTEEELARVMVARMEGRIEWSPVLRGDAEPGRVIWAWNGKQRVVLYAEPLSSLFPHSNGSAVVMAACEVVEGGKKPSCEASPPGSSAGS